MLINKKITALFIIFLAVIFLLPEVAFAQAADVFGTNDLADAGVNLGTRDLKETIAGLVNIFLGFLGILATLIMLYGGFIWMTSGGNADKIDKAKRILVNGVIGLVIVLSSYAIARFILREGYDGVFGTNFNNQDSGYVGGVGLGAGALDSHYPAPNAIDVPRNTNIYATFKEPMDVDFIVDNNNCSTDDQGIATCWANDSYVRLFEQYENDAITEDRLMVSYDTNAITGFRTFKFNPFGDTNEHLGNPGTKVRYRMEFGDLQTANDQPAFIGNAYSWYFTTDTILDITPPTVISVNPLEGSNSPRNASVQINFSEAINPAFVTGLTGNPNLNIFLTDLNDVAPTGRYKISNQYKTVEFITDSPCGVNSCGGEVYCLPGPTTIETIVGALVEDMAENSLDSNFDNIGSGTTEDEYRWTFNTTDEIDLIPPSVSSMENMDDLAPYETIEVTFSKPLLGSSVNSNNIDLVGPSPINYWFNLLSGDGSDIDLNSRTISISHGSFDPNSDYTPTMTSGIKDLSQNCWYPSFCTSDDDSCVSDIDTSLDCTNGTHCDGQIII